MSGASYREVQPLLRNRLFLFVFLPLPFLLLFITYGAVQQLIFDKPFGAQPAPDSLLGTFWLILVVLTLFMTLWRLVTNLRDDEIHVYLAPLRYPQQRIPFSEVITVLPESYDPWRDHGGWGWRLGETQVFTAYGSSALRLKLQDGQSVLLGTQRQEKLAAAIREEIETLPV